MIAILYFAFLVCFASADNNLAPLVGCTGYCHPLTSGPCQHPNLNDMSCYELEEEGTCEQNLVDCGARPTWNVTAQGPVPDFVQSTSSSSPTPLPSPSASTSPSTLPNTSFLDFTQDPNGLLERNKIVAEGVTMGETYEVSFTITQHGLVGGWGSVAHFSNGQNCCGLGERVPGIWYRPNSQTMIHVFGQNSNGNEHFNCPSASIGETAHFTFRVESNDAYCIMTRADGTETQTSSTHNGRRSSSNVRVYVADPWYTAAAATVSNFDFKESL